VAGVALLAVAVGVWVAGAALFDRAPSADRSPPAPPTAEAIVSTAVPEGSPESPSTAEPREIADPPPTTAPAVASGPGELTVTEYGIGRAVENNRVVDPSDSFEEGSVATFLTRVRGASQGMRIRHVWIRDGKAVQSIELPLGGTHWRTHSRKTLWGPGEWSVEARDLDDRVLASVGFTCVPKR
jgi:hypothetical protein